MAPPVLEARLVNPPETEIAPPAPAVVEPASIFTLPPAAFVDAPLLIINSPPTPEVPLPTLIDITPPLPPVARPDPIIMAPELPELVVPELKTSFPVAPFVPALALLMAMEPLVVAWPSPDIKLIAPPVETSETPAKMRRAPPPSVLP
jgi:hypothetical protein